jgi:hypothetical protein
VECKCRRTRAEELGHADEVYDEAGDPPRGKRREEYEAQRTKRDARSMVRALNEWRAGGRINTLFADRMAHLDLSAANCGRSQRQRWTWHSTPAARHRRRPWTCSMSASRATWPR